MNTPTTIRLGGEWSIEYPYTTDDERDKFVKSVLVPNMDKRVACWNGHEFELLHVVIKDAGNQEGVYISASHADISEQSMLAYYPIDPRMIESDIVGAIKAYPNDDNTGWLFAHTDTGTHHDYELVLLATLDGIIQPLFRQIQVDQLKSNDGATTARLNSQFTLLSEFYGQCVAEARNNARKVWLGKREQEAHPKNGYLDTDLTTAIETVETRWRNTKIQEDLAKMTTAFSYLRTSLTMPVVETRWDRVTRLEAAAKKAKQQSETETETPQPNNG